MAKRPNVLVEGGKYWMRLEYVARLLRTTNLKLRQRFQTGELDGMERGPGIYFPEGWVNEQCARIGRPPPRSKQPVATPTAPKLIEIGRRTVHLRERPEDQGAMN